MTKLQTAAVTAAFAAGVATHVGLAAFAQPTRSLEVVNMKLVRNVLPDAGVEWSTRACAYETADGVRLGEPCWQATIPNYLVAPVERALLDQHKK